MSDIKKLLEAMDSMSSAEKHSRGPKFPGYWKGKDPASKSKSKMVGANESIIKDLSEGPSLEFQLEKKLQEQWAQFKEQTTPPLGTAPAGTTPSATTAPGTPATGTTPTTTANTKPGTTPTIAPADAAALKKNLATLKTVVPGLDLTKASTSIAKADTGTTLNPTDQATIAKMAPQLANVIKNPQMATQLKSMIDKAGKTELAQQQKTGTIK